MSKAIKHAPGSRQAPIAWAPPPRGGLLQRLDPRRRLSRTDVLPITSFEAPSTWSAVYPVCSVQMAPTHLSNKAAASNSSSEDLYRADVSLGDADNIDGLRLAMSRKRGKKKAHVRQISSNVERGADTDYKAIWSKRLKLLLPGRQGVQDASTYRRKPKVRCISADPRKILFTRPCIDDKFSCGRTLASTIEDLSTGRILPGDIPMITVVRRHDRLLTLDHRRLYAFRAALPEGDRIKVKLLLSEWFADVDPQDCKVHKAVRVERSLDCSPPRAHLDKSLSRTSLSNVSARDLSPVILGTKSTSIDAAFHARHQ